MPAVQPDGNALHLTKHVQNASRQQQPALSIRAICNVNRSLNPSELEVDEVLRGVAAERQDSNEQQSDQARPGSPLECWPLRLPVQGLTNPSVPNRVDR